MNIKFATERLVVREIKVHDIEPLLKIYNKEENMRFISNGKFNWTENEIINKYKKTNENYKKGIGIFIIELKNKKIIGEVGLFNSFNNITKLEIGYIIDIEFQNKGFGKEVCLGVLKYAKEKLNTEIIIAKMYSKNKHSVKLSKSCGMNMLGSGFIDNNEEFYIYQKYL